MKTIGIIGAMSEEITYLKEKIEIVTTKNIIGLDFHVGKYCGNSIVLVISGIGKVNAAVCTQVLTIMWTPMATASAITRARAAARDWATARATMEVDTTEATAGIKR